MGIDNELQQSFQFPASDMLKIRDSPLGACDIGF